MNNRGSMGLIQDKIFAEKLFLSICWDKAKHVGLAEKLRALSSTYLKEQFHEIFDPFCGQNPIQYTYIGTVSAKLLTARKHIYVNTEPVSFKNRKVPWIVSAYSDRVFKQKEGFNNF